MNAWVLHGINDIQYKNVEMPLPKADEVLIKVKVAGICGSDIPRVFDTGAHRHPLIIGHEFSGMVEGIGRNVNAIWLHRRVGVFPLIPCKKCVPCERQQYEMCSNYSYLGSRCNGGFAEYVTVPEENLIELPDGVSFEEAAMLEPMAVAVHAMRKGTESGTLPKDAMIAVCGLGTIGILLTMFLADAGYQNLYVIGNKDFQKNKALSLGITQKQFCDSRCSDAARWLKEVTGGVDVFFECVGRNETLSCAVESTGPSGRVVLVGNPYSDMTLDRNIYWRILRSQLTIMGTWNSSFTGEHKDDWHYVMKRLETHSIIPTNFITHRLPLERLYEGLAIMHRKTEDYCKIMVQIDDR